MERMHARTSKPADVQRKPEASVSTAGDRYEREADRAADAVLRGGDHAFSISRLGDGQVQRQEAGSRTAEAEKRKEAALKAAEAFLATSYGKQLKEAVADDPLVRGVADAASSFVSTLPGKIVTGAAAAGVVTALGATNQGLPLQVPEIPLDRLTPGLSAKVTYEGPVFNPRKAMITFTYRPPGPKTNVPSDSERARAETAKLAAEQAKFRAGLRYTPGSAAAREQEAEEAAIREVVGFGKLPGERIPPKASLGFDTGAQLKAPSYGFKPKPPSLLDEELQLKPLTEVAPAEDIEKEEEGEAGVQRKADGDAQARVSSEAVSASLAGSGEALDARTRSAMEARFGRGFGHVRVHTGARAAQSARELHAVAYTAGADIAFAPGQYAPHSPRGRHLLAHELAHVVQQTGAAPAPLFVQRRSVLESIGIFFGLVEGDFSDQELEGYLRQVTKDQRIEGSYDSDNKARAIVRRWRAADPKFNLVADQKVLLIKEMLDGPTLDADERAILDLLRFSDNADLRQILGPSGVTLASLDSNFQGDEQDELDAFVGARFRGGRNAAEAGLLEPRGDAAKGAPQFSYDWAVLKAKVEGNYGVDDLVTEVALLPRSEREQALHDLTAERVRLNRLVGDLGERIEAESDASKQARLQEQRIEAITTRTRVEWVMHTLFKDIARAEPQTLLESRTRDLTAAQKAEALEALKPDVRLSITGTPLAFVDTLPGETKSYEQKMRELMPGMIQSYWDSTVKDRGVAEHSDPAKVHELKEFEDIGNVAKRETDAVFGNYYDPAAHPKLRADTPGRRGNIHDLFADTERDLRRMTRAQRRTMARRLLLYFFQSDRDVRSLNDDHNASPRFDSHDRPQNDEAKALAKLADEFTSTDAEVQKLNEIDRGWDASAFPATGDINIQIFRQPTTDEDRDFLWDMFQTLIHEYMHTLADPAYRRFANRFGRSSNENNTLIEGVDSFLSEIVWTNVEPRVNDSSLRAEIEGPSYSQLPPIRVAPPSRRRYPSYTEAVKLVGVVGIRNLYAAYFMGDVEKIGG